MRLAIRSLFRSPAYAATSIGTIALTIALGATVFAIVDGVLFKPLPYRDPHQVFYVVGSSREASSPTAALSWRDVTYLREADPRIQVTAFAAGLALTHPDRPDITVWTAAVPRNFFDVLGQQPLVGGFAESDFGRTFGPADVRAAIVSHAFWQQRLGGDPAAVGRTVDMMERRFLIAGILPRDFVFPSYDGRRRPDFLLATSAAQENQTDRWARAVPGIARIPDGMSRDEATAKLSAALAARASEYTALPQEMQPGPYIAVEMEPINEIAGANERRFFRAAFAGAALIVLLGAINVAGLFGAKSRDREREIAIRSALGAGRRQLVGVLISEALLIAIFGGIAGVLIAGPALMALLTVLPDTMLLLKPARIDWRVLIFAFVGAVIPLVLFASLPAAAAISRAPAHRLAGATTTTPRERRWGRQTLLVAESAIGILLLLAGSLTLASFVTFRAEDVGFDSERIAMVEMAVVGRPPAQERAALHARAVARIRQVPGIVDVAYVLAPLFENLYAGSTFTSPAGSRPVMASAIGVSASFFDVAGLSLVDGRYLSRAEIESRQPVVVVSEGTARAFWPGRRAVGQVLESRSTAGVTVVGVVEEAKFGSQAEDQRGFGGTTEIYLPEGFAPGYRAAQSARWMVLAKTANPDAAVSDLRLILRRDVPGVAVRRAESLDSAVAKSVRLYGFRTLVFSIAGGAGLLILLVGVIGVVASGVARRVREIGIRSALGAEQSVLTSMIVLEHLRPVMLGVAAGLLLAWWSTRLLSAFLYQIDPHEPIVWATAAMMLMVAAAAAAWIPARRASAVDPVTVLRAD
jgi:putative ABC transport system permease protein